NAQMGITEGGSYAVAPAKQNIGDSQYAIVANVPTVTYELSNLTTNGKGYMEVKSPDSFHAFTATLAANGGYSLPKDIVEMADGKPVPKLGTPVPDYMGPYYTWDPVSGIVKISNLHDATLQDEWHGWGDGMIPAGLLIKASGVGSGSSHNPSNRWDDGISKTVTKLWLDDNAKDRPDDLEIELLRDDKVYKSYTLKASENWKHTFNDCLDSGVYSVREVNVPKGYIASYDQNKLTITNSGSDVSAKLNTTNHFAYIKGNKKGMVCPEKDITRGEAAAIFYRLLTDEYRTKIYKTSNNFTDVTGKWYNTEVSTLANAGIVTSYADGSFRGDKPITRAEFASIAAKFVTGTYTGKDKFTDISGHSAAKDINVAAEFGWVNGYTDNTFRPDTYITRAEVMNLVNHVLLRDKLTENSFMKKMISWPDNNNVDMWYYKAVQEATNSHDYTRDKNGIE
ncbi:MAG: S-layer homology domain-containing protein, partial [Clostridiales bacterium]